MRKIAMFACERSYRTPSMRIRKDFTSLFVAGLGGGDKLVGHFSGESLVGGSSRELLEGLSPLPPGTQHIALEKIAGEPSSSTSVELLSQEG